MSAKRKLTTLTLQEKFDVINTVKTGMKKKDVAAQYGIPASTLSTIIKNEAEILLRYEKSGNISYKRRRVAEFPDFEEGLLTWFKQCRDKNISVSGRVLREKAEEYSKLLGHNSFRANNGWLDYEPKDIFNADETGLFFKCLPDKTLIFKNEKCYGGKHSKERLTILLATNMTGSEKLKPLVIGKSKKPRCFSGCKSLPLDYEANTKAWMTSEIFKEWLLKIDKKMIKDKRNILLFIDNCTAHNVIPPLKAIKVKFLPPNTTSKLQPLDQGIIKNFKSYYRKEVVRKLIGDMEQHSNSPITVLQAMRMADKAWRSVSARTISNCFNSCGFSMPLNTSTPEDVLKEVLEDANLDELQADWNQLQNIEVQFEDYVTCDDDLATTGTLTDAEIIDIVNQNDTVNPDDLDDADLSNSEPAITTKQAREAVDTLRSYVERCIDIEDHSNLLANFEHLVKSKTR
ncbi:tigger transposable element-derived protein 6-like [Microplitis mediator]|uniref:tigger transposable element-derived protein 6-like n=1 Tax=Microplitis mediator TaxID=375433 RepID=UPI0025549001|nr:tigger transposable element-derived protein 6-like [Microplitis mediator]XP_057335440.1 tigger transposable element-derived protein 6-like [Microplitis mediator]